MNWNRKVTNNEYIVIKHPLRDSSNTYFNGIKFTRGYAVVVKNSKSHQFVKTAPFLKNRKEFDLAYLKNIFRLKEVELIYGKDVYWHYLKSIGLDKNSTTPTVETKTSTELEKNTSLEATHSEEVVQPDAVDIEDSVEEQALENTEILEDLTVEQQSKAHKTLGLCSYIRKKDNKVCTHKALKSSPAGYCFAHIRFDPDKRKK